MGSGLRLEDREKLVSYKYPQSGLFYVRTVFEVENLGGNAMLYLKYRQLMPPFRFRRRQKVIGGILVLRGHLFGNGMTSPPC